MFKFKKDIIILKVFHLSVIFFILILSVTIIFYAKSLNTNDENTISFTGEGVIYITENDVASISFTFSEVSTNISTAKNIVSSKVDSIYSKLKDFGIEDKDIKTIDFSIRPEKEYDRSIKKYINLGQKVSHTSNVKIRNLDIVNDVLDEITKKDPETLGNLSFEVSEDVKRESVSIAMARAIQNAKIRAKKVSKEANIEIGKIVSINFNTNTIYEPSFYDARSISLSRSESSKSIPPISQGEREISAIANVIYSLKD